ncbi:MAG TPA: sulfur oxidation c-type cytochrome SoxX [Alphaproteobacteria bacterium]|mgnify:CR=1 FL=1|nr:sulfur oxidation c-type cytochrome SoxX [Alphaproteobacteria bacterium]
MKYRTIIAAAVGFAFFGAMSSGAEAGKGKKIPTSISKSFTGKPGNAAKGKKLIISRKKGNCLACHAIPNMSKQADQGNVGPPLKGVANRLSMAQLRARIANPKGSNPGTIMPAFLKKDGLNRVMKKFKGKSILSRQEVEDVLAYMMTLKGK